MSGVSGKLDLNVFSMICTSLTHLMHPLDSTQLLGYK
jgi:hypothetical protein